MPSKAAFLLSLLAASTWAAPGAEPNPPCKRAVCNADNCLRAVRATSAKPFASSGTADCSSFMQKTVTPCAATSTTTTTVTVTAQPVSVTLTATALQTQVNTVFETITSAVTTIEDTVTFIQPTEVDVVNIIVTAVTVTANSPVKRGAYFLPLPAEPTMLRRVDARFLASTFSAAPTSTAPISTCAATTKAPTNVPTYASACSGTVRYSSACSCAGVTGGTTTLPQSTVTATSTSTVTYTPTSTVTTTITNQVLATLVQTQIVPTIFETTDATVIVPSAFTVVSDIVIPTTVVVSPPVCSSYNFVATNGFRAGQFLSGGTPDPSLITYGFVNFTGDPSQAMAFTIRPDGRVYGGNNVYGWTTNGNSVYYILQMTDNSQSTYGIRSVYCSIDQGASSYPGAIGQLSCTSAGAPSILEYCPQLSNNLGQTPRSVTPGCTAANLAVLPAC